ncbi:MULTISPECIES: hypothetical protein [Bacillus]|uniref:hypothetical protein n=1 Tax=Bacillus TaxID=1386 RepID=UPI001483BC97|nr:MULTISPECIES: hypothetical protein [Bacillus]
MTTTLTAEDFKNAYEIYDVCTGCKKESHETQVILIEGKKVYRCPLCGKIN